MDEDIMSLEDLEYILCSFEYTTQVPIHEEQMLRRLDLSYNKKCAAIDYEGCKYHHKVKDYRYCAVDTDIFKYKSGE